MMDGGVFASFTTCTVIAATVSTYTLSNCYTSNTSQPEPPELFHLLECNCEFACIPMSQPSTLQGRGGHEAIGTLGGETKASITASEDELVNGNQGGVSAQRPIVNELSCDHPENPPPPWELRPQGKTSRFRRQFGTFSGKYSLF